MGTLNSDEHYAKAWSEEQPSRKPGNEPMGEGVSHPNNRTTPKNRGESVSGAECR
jgi:hypothetical protein